MTSSCIRPIHSTCFSFTDNVQGQQISVIKNGTFLVSCLNVLLGTISGHMMSNVMVATIIIIKQLVIVLLFAGFPRDDRGTCNGGNDETLHPKWCHAENSNFKTADNYVF